MTSAIGILAHVDAGKTTLSEQLLYAAHSIRRPGRVDHGDTLLDNHPIEIERGITVFSAFTGFTCRERDFVLIDTPGHADFSAEAERACSVLDLAVIVISAADGVQSHTLYVWDMLRRLNIPVLFFINKTDLVNASVERSMSAIRSMLTGDAVLFTADKDSIRDELALRDEAYMEKYLSGSASDANDLSLTARLVKERALFPVYTGSALNGTNVNDLLNAIAFYTPAPASGSDCEPRAVCWKVTRDKNSQRLCCLRLLEGTLCARDTLSFVDSTVKIGEIRTSVGGKWESVRSVEAGSVFAVSGMNEIRIGDIIGRDPVRAGKPDSSFLIQSTVICADKERDRVYAALKELEDEDPQLYVSSVGTEKKITLCTKGHLQLEILRKLMADRYSLAVSFGNATVRYRETIASPCAGIGHYEPLRHYAEVWVRLSPSPETDGVRFISSVHTDDLALSWQRLIETHVMEKVHKGVLTGSPLTNVTVELLAGRAHLKHTEGGDFREATYRAIRNALMNAQSVILEPVCRYELWIPEDRYSVIQRDLAAMHADRHSEMEAHSNGTVYLCGDARFSLFSPWQMDLPAKTGGAAICRTSFLKYVPVEDPASVIEEAGYDPLSDDSPDSIFCSHGAGHQVPWDQAPLYAHLHPLEN